jgi:hypothetical protein
LHRVGPFLLGGRIAHPLRAARQALRFYRDFSAEAPDSVIVYARLATGPDGQPRLGWRAVVNGPAEDAEPLLAPLRAYGTPLLDDIRPQRYVDIQRIIEPLFLPGRLNYWKANFVDELSDELIDVIIDAMTRVPSPHTLIAIEPMGGAIARVPHSATAFQHRSPSIIQPPHPQWLGGPCRHRREHHLGPRALRAHRAAVLGRGLRQLPRTGGRPTGTRRFRDELRAAGRGEAAL